MSIDAKKLRELIRLHDIHGDECTWEGLTDYLYDHAPAIADLADEVAKQAARIDAAKKRMRDCKAIHSRWFDGHDPRDKSDILNEIESVLYSAMLYLDGEEGPYRPDLAARTALAKPAKGGARVDELGAMDGGTT